MYAFVCNSPVLGVDPLGQRSWFTEGLCYCLERLIAAVVRGHTDAAWRNFAVMRPHVDPVVLSGSDMDEVIKAYDVKDEMIDPLLSDCKSSGSGWTGKRTQKGLDARSYYGYSQGQRYYYGDPGWGAALGGVRFTVTSTCKPAEKKLEWTVSLKDSWDFDNWRSGVTQLPRNVIVALVKIPNAVLNCRWWSFNHKGSKSGTESW